MTIEYRKDAGNMIVWYRIGDETKAVASDQNPELFDFHARLAMTFAAIQKIGESDSVAEPENKATA